MQAKRAIIAVAGLGLMALSACGSDEAPNLMNLRSNNADEFSIVPTKPLEMPKDYAALPAPTPGGSNLVDPTPEADAIAALGGNAAAADKPIPASDSALVARTGRYGRQDNIRNTLAAEDLQWRKDHRGRLLERAFSVNMYFKAYRQMTLDQQAELARWRARGVQTVGAPPSAEDLPDN